MELHLGRVISGGNGNGLARLNDILGGDIVLHLGNGVLAGNKVLHINLALLVGYKGLLVPLARDDKGDTLHKTVLGGLADEQPSLAADDDGLVPVLQVGVDGNLFALLVNALKDNDGLTC